MDVAVGSHSDPVNLPGLAHFLEHMLFLGTRRYPDEESYKRFLAENGGSSNAYTANENTNFHFGMIAKKGSFKLKEALDRFAQFFIAPLFTESATQRELHAVQSEFERNLQSDGWRTYQVFRACANPEHPVSRFTIGSKHSLFTLPNELGINVREQLIAFHSRYYSANLMNLCVVAPHDLDTLQDWVVDLFSDIRNSNVPHPCDEFKHISPFLDRHRGRRVYIETVKDFRRLDVIWDIPAFIADYRSMPCRLICSLIDDEGKGSILSLLKAREWADSVYATADSNNDFGFLYVSICLTKKGVDHIDEIVHIVYACISLMKRTGVPKWFYEEEKQVAANSFRFRERDSALSLATQLAELMQHYPSQDYLSAGWLFSEYRPDRVANFLHCLTPERGNISICGQFVASKTTVKEPWFGTRYHVEPIEQATLALWAIDSTVPGLSLPEPNHLIPTDFSILTEQLPPGENDLKGPVRILKNHCMDVHYKLDRSFNRPKVKVFIEFATPLANQSPWHAIMFSLYCTLLEDSMAEYSSIVERAGLNFSFISTATGLQLRLSGYNDGIEKLGKEIVERMSSFEPDATRFEMIRDITERGIMNLNKKSPSAHASRRLASLLVEPTWSLSDQLACLQDDSINFGTMTIYSKEVLNRLFVTGLAHGNITETSIIGIMKSVQEIVGFVGLRKEERRKRRVVRVPFGNQIFSRQAHPNFDDVNSAIEVYYQLTPVGDFRKDVIYELLADILEEPLFHELRTVQQLGYMVVAGLQYYNGVGGIQISIQSAVAGSDELLRRIDQFLVDVRQNLLGNMSKEKFQEYVDASVASKAEPDSRLSIRTGRFWGELLGGYLQYDRAEREVEELRTVTKDNVVKVFDDCIALDGKETRRIVSQVYGSQHPFSEREDLPVGAVDICDPTTFRRRNSLWPMEGHRMLD